MFSPASTRQPSSPPASPSSLPESGVPAMELPADLTNPLTTRILPAQGRAAQAKVVQLISGLEFLAPLLTASAPCFPSPAQQVAWLQQTLASVDTLLASLPTAFQKSAQLPDNPWVAPALAKILLSAAFAPLLDTGASRSSPPSPSALDKSFNRAFLSLSGLLDNTDFLATLADSSLSLPPASPDTDQLQASPLTHVKLAWLDFLASVAAVQSQYSFSRPDPAADLLTVSSQAWAALLEIYQPLVPKYAFLPDRVALLVSLIRQLAPVFVGCWAQEGRAADQALAGKSKTTIAAWQRKNPQGFPLTTVWQKFAHQSRSITTLARLASHLGTPAPTRHAKVS